MDNTKHKRLQELDRSDFEIVKGETDIRGWDVKNGAGLKIGEVEELIVDAQKKKVRYMVVDLDDKELKIQHRKVLIPIGLAELDKKEDDVLLPAITVDHLNSLPAYEKENLDEEAEHKICSILGRNTTAVGQRIMNVADSNSKATKPAEQNTEPAPQHEDDFYQHEYFHDDNLYKHRLHEAGQQKKDEPSEYEKGLRLWELRSEGGIVAGETTAQPGRTREANEEKRMELVRNRRREYEERRGSSRAEDRHSTDPHRKGKSIIDRIRDEGLQDAP
jgi:hypothetical protein